MSDFSSSGCYYFFYLFGEVSLESYLVSMTSGTASARFLSLWRGLRIGGYTLFYIMFQGFINQNCIADFPCSSLCTASGSGLTLATAGTLQKFTITARTDRDFSQDSRDLAVVPAPNFFSFVAHLGGSPQQSMVTQTASMHPHRRIFVGSLQPTVVGTEYLSLKLVKCKINLCHLLLFEV